MDGVDASWPAQPGEIFGEVPVALGSRFPVGFRAAGPRGSCGWSRTSTTMRRSCRTSRRRSGRRPPIGYRARTACRASVRGATAKRGSSSATAGTPPAPSSGASSQRNQISFEWLHPRRTRRRERWGGPCPPDDECPVDPGRRRHDGRAAAAPRGRRLLGLQTEPARRSTTRSSSAAARPGSPRRCTAPPRGCGRSWSSARRRAGRRARRRGSRTTSASRRASPATSSPAARSSRRAGSAPRSSSRGRPTGSTRNAHRRARRRRGRTRPHDHPRHRGGVAAPRARRDRPLIGKGIHYGAARSEAVNTHGLDVELVGAGNSAGQAALFFAGHARTVTIVCRGDALEKTMSQYLVQQLTSRA